MAVYQKLSQLAPGNTGRVLRLEASGATRRHLQDLGLVPGTLVKSIRRSPAGDPIAYNIRGAVIALREEESKLIYVQIPDKSNERVVKSWD